MKQMVFWLLFGLTTLQAQKIKIKINDDKVSLDGITAFRILDDQAGGGFDILPIQGNDTLMTIRHHVFRDPGVYTPSNPTGRVEYYLVAFPSLKKVCEMEYPKVPSKRYIVNDVIVANDLIWDSRLDKGMAEVFSTTRGMLYKAQRDSVARKYGIKKVIIK
ncbi:MAG: hypothetical protein O3C46_05175 [Bacteroidetes bacterium]|nr:hypothetical protein [Bacteroidota bacterium]